MPPPVVEAAAPHMDGVLAGVGEPSPRAAVEEEPHLESLPEQRTAKRQRLSPPSSSQQSSQESVTARMFGSGPSSRLFLGAETASVEWRIERFQHQRWSADGTCMDGPTFGPRAMWQIFCHPDGRCFNQPQGGPPGVFLRYLGPHERVPAYATIEQFVDGDFRVPENNSRDSPFVVLFGRNEIEEWGVCKDFGLFDDAFGQDLQDEALVLRARVAWVEPRPDSLLPREVLCVRRNATFPNAEGSIQADLGALWNMRRPTGMQQSRSPAASGGPAVSAVNAAVPADLTLLCEGLRFEADRSILAARSSFFSAMLSSRPATCPAASSGASGGFREAVLREVAMPDLTARALGAALRFVYTDEGPEMTTREEAEEQLSAASKLGIPGMLRLCSDYLRDNWLTMDRCCSLLALADMHGATSLRAEALAVLGANFDAVKTTAEWDDLLRNSMNPALIQDAMQAVADASIFAGRASIKL